MFDNPQFNCETEPIHIPGKIQDNGFLIAFHAQKGTITYASENMEQYVGITAKAVLAQQFFELLPQILHEDEIQKIRSFFTNADLTNYQAKNCVSVDDLWGNKYVMVAHASAEMIIVEFESLVPDNTNDDFDFSDAYASIVSFNSIRERCTYLCESIRKFSNYDRVMIYKFDDAYNGEVIAESNAPGVHSFLHHHFPSTDIPQQARDLYLRNLMRIIADVNDTGSAVLATAEAGAQPLDLSYSILRAVSPVHVTYLKNMGVQASFSTSIVVQGKLWGLVTCHNFKPALISYSNRFNCRTLTQILGNSIFIINSYDAIDQKSKYSKAFGDVVKTLALNSDLKQILPYKLNEATGAAYIKNNEVETFGETPTRAEILSIVENIFEHSREPLFITNSLISKMDVETDTIEKASGVLAMPLSEEIGEMYIWFKPEMTTQVKWAGNPEKIITEYKGKPSLNPRTSFLSWSEKVSGMSAEWSLGEIEIAKTLQEEIKNILHIKAREVKELHEKLKMAYDELSTFSYTVSHDLKMPLTGIKNYAELIALTETGLSEDAVSYLNTVISGADRMNTLINEIFNYTRAGLTEIEAGEIEIKPIIERVVTEAKAAYGDNVQVSLGELMDVRGDEMMLYQVFSNIISNAIKYSSKAVTPKVSIISHRAESKVIYQVSDNGIGIPAEELNKLFLPFERMSNSKSFEGTGLGMAIVKRIIDKHRAEIDINSTINEGTVCTITFTGKI